MREKQEEYTTNNDALLLQISTLRDLLKTVSATLEAERRSSNLSISAQESLNGCISIVDIVRQELIELAEKLELKIC